MNEKTASQAGKTETMKKGHNKISGIKNTTLEINHQMCQKQDGEATGRVAECEKTAKDMSTCEEDRGKQV